jgi:hypothetical protein
MNKKNEGRKLESEKTRVYAQKPRLKMPFKNYGTSQEAAAGTSGQLEQQHDSPSGSEVSEAGPSGAPYRRPAGGATAHAGQQRPRSSCSPGSPTGKLLAAF